jgi:Tfp pilus assembly protein PilF
VKYYEYALKLDSENTAVLDSYAAFLTDMDDFDRAKQLLEKR